MMLVLLLATCILGSVLADSQNVLDRLDKLENEVNYLRQKDATNEEIIREQKQVIADLAAKFHTIEDTLKHEKQPDLPGNKERRIVLVDDGVVAFTSKLRKRTTDNIPLNSPLIFPEVDMNDGAGYNVNTGEFTAPQSGIYLLSLSVLAHNGPARVVHGEIVRDGVAIARAMAYAEPAHRDQGSVTVLAKLTHGARVWVRSIDVSGATLGGELFSTFSGYLLYPM